MGGYLAGGRYEKLRVHIEGLSSSELLFLVLEYLDSHFYVNASHVAKAYVLEGLGLSLNDYSKQLIAKLVSRVKFQIRSLYKHGFIQPYNNGVYRKTEIWSSSIPYENVFSRFGELVKERLYTVL